MIWEEVLISGSSRNRMPEWYDCRRFGLRRVPGVRAPGLAERLAAVQVDQSASTRGPHTPLSRSKRWELGSVGWYLVGSHL